MIKNFNPEIPLFEEDELRRNGFSKDNKSQQPQILVVLMVTKEGYPIAYSIFSGNTLPIFHFKEELINLHVLICYMALVGSKHIELATGDSIRKFLTECKKVMDARMINKITNKETRIKTKYNDKILKYLKSLNLPH